MEKGTVMTQPRAERSFIIKRRLFA